MGNCSSSTFFYFDFLVIIDLFWIKLPNYAFMLSLLRSVVQYSVSNPTSFDRASFWLQEYMMTAGLLCFSSQ